MKLASREVSAETRGGELLQAQGCLYLKVGTEGLPDRLVIFAPGRHFWIEWKKPGGDYTKAQKVRIPQMVKQGEPVFTCETPEDALHALWRMGS